MRLSSCYLDIPLVEPATEDEVRQISKTLKLCIPDEQIDEYKGMCAMKLKNYEEVHIQ